MLLPQFILLILDLFSFQSQHLLLVSKVFLHLLHLSLELIDLNFLGSDFFLKFLHTLKLLLCLVSKESLSFYLLLVVSNLFNKAILSLLSI